MLLDAEELFLHQLMVDSLNIRSKLSVSRQLEGIHLITIQEVDYHDGTFKS